MCYTAHYDFGNRWPICFLSIVFRIEMQGRVNMDTDKSSWWIISIYALEIGQKLISCWLESWVFLASTYSFSSLCDSQTCASKLLKRTQNLFIILHLPSLYGLTFSIVFFNSHVSAPRLLAKTLKHIEGLLDISKLSFRANSFYINVVQVNLGVWTNKITQTLLVLGERIEKLLFQRFPRKTLTEDM